MYRNCMAWFPPTVAALFAAVILTILVSLTTINPSHAQSSDLQKNDSGWNVNLDTKALIVTEQATIGAEPTTIATEPTTIATEPTTIATEPTTIATESTTSADVVPKKVDLAAENVAAQEADLDQALELNTGTTVTETTLENETPQDSDSLQESHLSVESNLAERNQAEIPDPAVEEGAQAVEEGAQAVEERVQTVEERVQADAIASQQLTQDLEQQLQQLKQTLQTEDAFSSKLGEDYLGYGKLLRKSGQLDEAIKALTSALHIAKVNNGIYSIEQRAALRELFNIHFDLANIEDFEDYLGRILWVENKNSEVTDKSSFELLLKVGNHYIDQFLRNPVAGQRSLDMLLRARYHFITAVRAFGNRPISDELMPYGELALISFLESRVKLNDSRPTFEDSRRSGVTNYAGSQPTRASYVANPFSKGESYLQVYLRKAQREASTEHVVHALTSLGDLNQLFDRHSNAGRYYELAWLAAQDLDQSQPAIINFNRPTLLPDFNYAFQRQIIPSNRETVSVSLILSIGRDGKVKKVQRADPEDGLEKYFPRARRAVKRLVFRPQLVDAKAVATENIAHTTKVRLRK